VSEWVSEWSLRCCVVVVGVLCCCCVVVVVVGWPQRPTDRPLFDFAIPRVFFFWFHKGSRLQARPPPPPPPLLLPPPRWRLLLLLLSLLLLVLLLVLLFELTFSCVVVASFVCLFVVAVAGSAWVGRVNA